MRRLTKLSQPGFTIIELLIATSILSVILLLATVTMVGINNLYYKGINQANVQDNARSIADELSKELQFNGTASMAPLPTGFNTGGAVTWCVGSTRYSYILYKQLGSGTSTTSQHVLWRDTPGAGNCTPLTANNLNSAAPTPATPTNQGQELMANGTRLTALSITPNTVNGHTTYNLIIGVAFGGDDLLCDSGITAPVDDCTFIGVSQGINNLLSNPGALPVGSIHCKGNQGVNGDQYCSTSNLQTVADERV